MTNCIRIAFGDSDATTDGLEADITFQGMLQGSRAVHTSWVSTNTPQLNLVHMKCFGKNSIDDIEGAR